MKPQVKPSEKSRILETKDYSLFNLKDFKVSKKFLNVVKESIDEKNLSKDYPILVDNNYNILDGKYRFLALYELGLAINYKIAEITTIEDAIRVKHIHKNIPLHEVIKLYSSLKNYNDLILLKDQFGFDYRIIVLAAQDQNSNSFNRIDRKVFNSGKFSFEFEATRSILTRVEFISNEFKWPPFYALELLKTNDAYQDIKSIIDHSIYFRYAVKLHESEAPGRNMSSHWRYAENVGFAFDEIFDAIHAVGDENPWGREFVNDSIVILKKLGVTLKQGTSLVDQLNDHDHRTS